MEKVITDIIFNILSHLDRDSSFHFTGTSKTMLSNRIFLYEKYLFNHRAIKNNEIKQYIKKCRLMGMDELEPYKNLINATIEHREHIDIGSGYSHVIKYDNLCESHSLSHLSKKLQSLRISSLTFNYPLNNLPNTLTSLYLTHINGFNQPLDNLPKTLRVLSISLTDFNHPLNELPETLNQLHLCCESFNNSLDDLPMGLKNLFLMTHNFTFSLDKLPQTLLSLTFYDNKFRHPLDNLPGTLTEFKFLSIGYNHQLNNLPQRLQSYRMNDNAFDNPQWNGIKNLI